MEELLMSLYNLIEKKRKEKKKKIIKAAVVSTVVGGGIGALSGILLAPKSGKNTRNDIKEKVNSAKAKTIEQSENLKNNIKEAKSKIKDYLKDRKDKKAITSEEVEKEQDLTEEVSTEETVENNI